MTFFPCALHPSTSAWLFQLPQIGTVDARLHDVSQLFFAALHVYVTANAITMCVYASV